MTQPSYRQRMLGERLRALRGAMTLEKAATRTGGLTFSKLCRIEGAKSGVKWDDVEMLLATYASAGTTVTDADREHLRGLATHRPQRPWWYAFRDTMPTSLMETLETESDATAVQTWALGEIPALLQSPSYLRQMTTAFEPDPTKAEDLVQIGLARQSILTGPRAINLHAVIAEHLLHGARQEQLDHLALLALRPTITLQILPLDHIPPIGRRGAFTLLTSDPLGTCLLLTQPGLNALDVGDAGPYPASFRSLAVAALSEGDSAKRLAQLRRQNLPHQ